MRAVRIVVLAAVLSVVVVSRAAALDINAEVSMPDALVGTPYSFQFTADEGCLPYNFAFKAGHLPAGLHVEQNGLLTGTPTEAGRFYFWIEVTDGVPGGACHSDTPSQGDFTLIVSPQVVITAASLPGAKVGNAYNTAITATGGGSLAWTVTTGSLPPGLSLNRDTGQLSGTPNAVGSFPFTVQVGDDKRKATQQYTFVVAAPLAVAPAKLPAGEVGAAYTAAVTSSGGIGPFSWNGTAPAGLALDPAKGVISGTPKSAGSFSVPLKITDSDGQTVDTTVTFSIAARLAITTTKAPAATVGKAYRFRLASRGGVGSRKWAVARGKLPRGLRLDPKTATVSGIPRAAGRYPIIFKLSDALGVASTRTLTLVVRAT
jgi:large repetitive protein